MLKSFIQLLGDEADVFKRYAWKAVLYGVLSGLTMTALVPVLRNLLAAHLGAATMWLLLLLAGVVICWAWRREVEKASVEVRIAVLKGARQRVGDHIARLPVGWFTAQHTARLNHVLTHGMFELSELPGHLLTPIISGVVTPLVFVVTLFALHWELGLMALLSLPVLVTVFMFSAKLGKQADEGFHYHAARTSQRIVEFAQAQSVLRAFSRSGTHFLEQAIDEQHQSGKKLIFSSTASVVMNAWFIQVVFAVLMLIAGSWLSTQMGATLHVEAITAVIASMLLLYRFVDPLLDVAGYGEILRSARGQLEAVCELFAIEPLSESRQPRKPIDASIEMQAVHFRYSAEQPEVLKGVSFSIAPGSMTALVGASGSGKSTLLKLIARFFEVSQGAVVIGGVDVRDMRSADLSSMISQIFQDTYLFQGSIADNIRIGKPDATNAQVLAAARQAGVMGIVERLPHGFETLVGEGGARLSGGERQRISIARALIKEAPILLVDEATAALDAENQLVIAQALAKLRGKCTLVVIAHQLSTIAMADHIVVFEDGMVREQGTHDALVAQQGLYSYFLSQRQMAKGWSISSES